MQLFIIVIFKFVSISKKAGKLKDQKFTVPTFINFDAEQDIYDIERIMREVQSKDIDTIVRLAEFLCKNIIPKARQEVRPSVIAYVINCLSDIDLNNAGLEYNIKPFNFLTKVNKNRCLEKNCKNQYLLRLWINWCHNLMRNTKKKERSNKELDKLKKFRMRFLLMKKS